MTSEGKTGDIRTIGIFGAGAFGTALAIAAARAGRKVVLYGRDAAQMRAIETSRTNERHLPGVTLTEGIIPTSRLPDLGEADAVLLATPAQMARSSIVALGPALRPGAPVIICAKGIERETGLFPSEIVATTLPDAPVAVLSGPSFARDVAAGLPTAVVLAAPDPALAETLAQALNSASFRVYHSADRRGVEIGGAAKNVLAIAAGIVEAQNLGDSAKAALIARGFAEMRRFAIACGAEAETLMGLSGLGDLVLTAGSPKSRNFSYGLALGQGASPEKAGAAALSEGAYTADILVRLAERHHLEMPICAAVAAIIDGRLTIRAAIKALISRPQKAE